MKLNKAEKFVKRQFEIGKTRNQIREAIYEKLGTWNFPPEYENALVTEDPNYDDARNYLDGTTYPDLVGVDYHDDYRCNKCGGRSESCFCDDPNEDRLNKILNEIPTPGGPGWDEYVEQIRAEMDRREQEVKLINATKRIIEAQGKDFNEEVKKWKEERK